MKKIAIVQSNYIPWKGYFDLISSVDEFILLDDVQYTRRDWRNRNLIKSASGLQWLTIPIENKGNFKETIKNIRVNNSSWTDLHWKKIVFSYGKAPFFKEFSPKIKNLYNSVSEMQKLSEINYFFITKICEMIEIKTHIHWSMNYQSDFGKNNRLLSICRQAGASVYVSGPAAKEYLDVSAFQAAGIDVYWHDYTRYPTYNQLFGEFIHGVSVLDTLFNCGSKAKNFIWQYHK